MEYIWSFIGATITLAGIIIGNIVYLFRFSSNLIARISTVETKVDNLNDQVYKINNVKNNISNLNSRVSTVESEVNHLYSKRGK